MTIALRLATGLLLGLLCACGGSGTDGPPTPTDLANLERLERRLAAIGEAVQKVMDEDVAKAREAFTASGLTLLALTD